MLQLPIMYINEMAPVFVFLIETKIIIEKCQNAYLLIFKHLILTFRQINVQETDFLGWLILLSSIEPSLLLRLVGLLEPIFLPLRPGEESMLSMCPLHAQVFWQ